MFFNGRHHSRVLGAIGGFAAVTALLVSTSVFAGDSRRQSEVEILWDEFGIPHIYGPDELSVVRGLGYAEMENHAETILINVASARGRSAEYFGPGPQQGTGYANIDNDILVRTEDIPNRAQAWLETGGEEQARIIQAFTDGANEYAKRHADTINPSLRSVLPFVPTDVTAGIQHTVHFTFMPEQDNLPDLIAAWQTGGISAANALARSYTPGGSNGWAIAPQKSASGNAILMGNPHPPWGNNAPIPPTDGLGIFQWMEVNLVIGDPEKPELNASGAVFVGAPFIGIGYSDEIGWTHTNNTIQNVNLYEITLNPNGTYNFGGVATPLQHRTDTFKVLQPNGSLTSQSIDIFASVHGPIIAQNGNKALALRVAGLQQPSAVTQYWQMIKARNLDEFIASNSSLQMPFFNVIYADRDGHILYSFGGQQPLRQGGDWSKYAGILDGSDPSLLWTKTFDWWDLPHAIDPPGGFVANGNNPPWTSTFPQTPTNDPTKYPSYVSPQFMDLRAQNGARFLQSSRSLTPAQVLLGKELTHMLLADRVLPDLIAAAQASGNPTAQQAAATLAAWDRTSDANSKGAVLFEAWWVIVSSDPSLAKDNTINFYSPHPKFRVGWSASDPLNTPVGLANPAATVPDLILAAQEVYAAYGALDVPWGAVHQVVLVTHDPAFQKLIPLSADPQSGADDPFGAPRTVYRLPAPDGKHFWAYSGDGYVQVVEFASKGAKAGALLGYGNASRPGSPHITDQLPFFDAKELRPTYRTYHEVENHTVSREFLSETPLLAGN